MAMPTVGRQNYQTINQYQPIDQYQSENRRQQPLIQPGFAIFCFPAGIVEMILHISVAILLIACLVLSAVTSNESIGSSTDNGRHYSFPLTVYASRWNISITGLVLIFELIYFVSRFLNMRCYNNYYTAYGILDIIRYILLAICLVIGCAGYAQGAAVTRGYTNECDRRAESIGEADTACGELRERATDYTMVAVLCGVAIGVTIVSVVWQLIYVTADCNSRLPVRREGDKA